MLLGRAIYEQKLMVANSVGIVTHRYKWHQNFDGSLSLHPPWIFFYWLQSTMDYLQQNERYKK